MDFSVGSFFFFFKWHFAKLTKPLGCCVVCFAWRAWVWLLFVGSIEGPHTPPVWWSKAEVCECRDECRSRRWSTISSHSLPLLCSWIAVLSSNQHSNSPYLTNPPVNTYPLLLYGRFIFHWARNKKLPELSCWNCTAPPPPMWEWIWWHHNTAVFSAVECFRRTIATAV